MILALLDQHIYYMFNITVQTKQVPVFFHTKCINSNLKVCIKQVKQQQNKNSTEGMLTYTISHIHQNTQSMKQIIQDAKTHHNFKVLYLLTWQKFNKNLFSFSSRIIPSEPHTYTMFIFHTPSQFTSIAFLTSTTHSTDKIISLSSNNVLARTKYGVIHTI